VIRPGELLQFRVPLGRLPPLWDSDSMIAPYVYYDHGRWLVAEPSPLVRLLVGHGWRENLDAEPMFTTMAAEYVWPYFAAGLTARFDLSAAEPAA
jgi:hypothetical protein